jgi:hypothetical protein
MPTVCAGADDGKIRKRRNCTISDAQGAARRGDFAAVDRWANRQRIRAEFVSVALVQFLAHAVTDAVAHPFAESLAVAESDIESVAYRRRLQRRVDPGPGAAAF